MGLLQAGLTGITMATSKTHKNIKILIVDDFDTTRKIIRNMLRDEGYENTVEARDGKLALQVLRKEKVELIISDWAMPNMDGLTFLKTVRSTPEFQNIPFIMVTAEAEKDNIINAIKAKVTQYIIKPFTAENLYDKVRISMGQ